MKKMSCCTRLLLALAQVLVAVVAIENGEAPLEITNGDLPVFNSPLYTVTINEDIAVGSVIVNVRATAKDSTRNAAIRYEVDDDHFSVNDNGDMETRKRLDADQEREGFHIYRFTVTARDADDPSLSSKALVHIRTENTNDEAPYFIPTRLYRAKIAEDAQGGTPIVTIHAFDPDRDQVSYSFVTPDGETTTTELFEIDVDTGVIKLHTETKPEDLSQNGMHVYNLTVQAKDDGSCCETTSTVFHKETATVIIGIADVNNKKPEFHRCSTYSSLAKIEEGEHKNGKTIIKVVATDDDSPHNGDIVYSLYCPEDESRIPFIIDPITGELRPSPNVVFDRETFPFEDVTVKATKKGAHPLIGFCQFTVTVTDVNDNAPLFDRPSYEAFISRDVAVGSSVLTVFTDDCDAPNNTHITYELKADEAAGEDFADDRIYFHINGESGEITISDVIPADLNELKFLVVANDNGYPEPLQSEVPVVISLDTLQESAPSWVDSEDCPAEIEVDENTQVDSLFFRCRAVSGVNPDNQITYSMENNVERCTNSLGDFRQVVEKYDGCDWAVICNLEALDYERTDNYTLTLTAIDTCSGMAADKQLRVLVVDKNDEVPRFAIDHFTGTIDEELTPEMFAAKSDDQPIMTVKAVDADSPGPQSEVRYSILNGPASSLFQIDDRTGAIYPLAKFDREKNDSFILDVEARDGMDSDLPGVEGPNKAVVKVQIFIGDINDNAPYFGKISHNGLIAENAEIGQEVLTVKAHDADIDSNLKYYLKEENSERIEFGVDADSGTIFVKEPLDFKTRNEYSFTLMATDGKHESGTSIFIQVENVNDNAPQFEQSLYETTVPEDDGQFPKTLLTVQATDRDEDHKSRDIVYRLEGEGVDEFLKIDENSGEISAIKPLDLDGEPTWNFIVQAIDDGGRGLIGYAMVTVTDTGVPAPPTPEPIEATTKAPITRTTTTSTTSTTTTTESSSSCIQPTRRASDGLGAARFGVNNASHFRVKFPKKATAPHFINFTLSFSFRTSKPNGILWMWANYNNYTRSFNMTLDDGHLQLTMKGRREDPVVMRIQEARLDDNHWHMVQINKRGKELRLQVDEFSMTEKDAPNPRVARTRMYVGGILTVHERLLQNRSIAGWDFPGFDGCMRDFIVDQKSYDLLDPKYMRDVLPCTKPTNSSYVHEEGFLRFDKPVYQSNVLQLGIEFRTNKADGWILVLLSTPNSDTRVELRLTAGKIVFKIKIDGADKYEHDYQPTDAALTCDGKWHRVSVILNTSTFEFSFDDKIAEPIELQGALSRADLKRLMGLALYVGGLPKNLIRAMGGNSLQGCFGTLQVGGADLGFDSAGRIDKALLNECFYKEERDD